MLLPILEDRQGFPADLPLYPWYAIAVRTGGESRVKRALEQKVADIFLPTHTVCRRYSDRIKRVDAALFPGYLFGRLDVIRRLPILTTPGVVSIVGLAGAPQPIEQSEIAAIQRVVQSGASAIPWPYLRTGDRVTIGFGALAGLTGILMKSRGLDRLVLSVHLLQRSISVEIDRAWVEPVRS